MRKTMSLLFEKRDQRGFTLIELLVVVAILGVLMAVGASSYLQYRSKGADESELAMATDFLTLMMADMTTQTSSKTYNATTLPPGFGYDATNSKIKIKSGSTITINTGGGVANATDAVTFESGAGTTSAVVQGDGSTANYPVAVKGTQVTLP